MNENKELKDLLILQNNKIPEKSNDTYVTNNKFNINIFLNEKCNNAININDFTNSLHIQIKDLEEIGRLGYVNGISRIFMKGLNELDVCNRPIHCSDLKREIIYVKDDNRWEKDETRIKIKSVIRQIANKNVKLLTVWNELNPECNYNNTQKNDQYNQLIISVMGGDDDEDKLHNKIITKLSKELTIKK
jgi:hypothetical protein